MTALAEVLVDGAVQHQSKLIIQLAKAGAPFECVLRALGFTFDPELVDFFASEFNFQALNEEDKTVLLATAVATGKVELVHSLILGKVNMDMKGSTKRYEICTPLIEAVKASRLDIVQLLLNNGAIVDTQCECRESRRSRHNALSRAVKSKNLKISQYLLERGARIGAEFEAVFDVKFDNLPEELCVFLKKLVGVSLVSEQDILDAAQSRSLLKSLLKYSQIPESLAIKAFDNLLDHDQAGFALNLLEVGPLQGAPSALSSLLDGFFDGQFLILAEVKSLFQKMHSRNIPLNSPRVIEGIFVAQLGGWAEAWDMDDRRAILDVLDSLGYDFETLGPAAIEGVIDIQAYFSNAELEQSVEAILQHGVSVNAYGNIMTPFQVAAYMGNLGLIEKMLNRGATLNKEPFYFGGMTALQAAALGNCFETVQYLIALGADIQAAPAPKEGFTALEAAIRPQISSTDRRLFYEYEPEENDVCEEIFSFLLDEEPRVLRLSDRPESPLLHDLIYRQLFHLLEKVLNMGTNPNHYFQIKEDFPYYSPLQLACILEEFEAIKLLLKYDADCNQSASDEYGRTALQEAILIECERMDIVEYLLDHGADVNAPPAEIGGVTALQAASIRGHFNIVRLLLKKGADVKAAAVTEEGRTAIEGAAEHGRLDMVQLLLNAQAAKNAVQKRSWRARLSWLRKTVTWLWRALLRIRSMRCALISS